MSAPLHLTITTPSTVLVDDPAVRSVRAEDASGGFGILPGHADLLTVLPASVVRWRGEAGAWRFCAVRGGVFTVQHGRTLSIACREGTVGDDLVLLEAQVRAYGVARDEEGRTARVEQTRLHALMMRQLMRYLRPETPVEMPDALSDGEGDMTAAREKTDRTAEAARLAAERMREGLAHPEPSLASRLGQIGMLGWVIVGPMLAGVLVGRWIDRWLGTGITFAAALIMLGAALGFRSAWRWMHRP